MHAILALALVQLAAPPCAAKATVGEGDEMTATVCAGSPSVTAEVIVKTESEVELVNRRPQQLGGPHQLDYDHHLRTVKRLTLTSNGHALKLPPSAWADLRDPVELSLESTSKGFRLTIACGEGDDARTAVFEFEDGEVVSRTLRGGEQVLQTIQYSGKRAEP